MWLALTLVTALCETGRDLVGKKGVASMDPLPLAFLLNLGGALALWPFALAAGVPVPGPHFVPALLIVGVLNTIAVWLYMKALRASDVSMAVPLIAFTPLLMIGLGPAVLGERPSVWGVAGMLMVVAGAYVLRLPDRRHGLLGPFRALLSDRGPRLMLMVAVLFSITSTFDKVGVKSWAPLAWVATVHTFGALALAPLAIPGLVRDARRGRLPPMQLVALGLFSAAGNATQMFALRLTVAAYVIAVKRLSVALTVVAGHVLLRERGFRERILAAGLMAAGVAVIAILGH